MQQYIDGKMVVYDLNMPSFASSFIASHKCFERIFARRLTNDDDIDEDDCVIYDSYIVINHNSLDPHAVIEVKPSSLIFKKKRDEQNFVLVCKVHPLPCGYISASLKWVARKYGESSREVLSRIILYENGFVGYEDNKRPPKSQARDTPQEKETGSSSRKRPREDSC